MVFRLLRRRTEPGPRFLKRTATFNSVFKCSGGRRLAKSRQMELEAAKQRTSLRGFRVGTIRLNRTHSPQIMALYAETPKKRAVKSSAGSSTAEMLINKLNDRVGARGLCQEGIAAHHSAV